MMQQEAWKNAVTQRVMYGLGQDLKLRPGVHYYPRLFEASRVVVLRLLSINPSHIRKVGGMQKELTAWAGLPEDHPVRLWHDGKAMLVEIPKPPVFWKPVTVETLEPFLRRGPVATLGLGLQDEPRRLNFAQPDFAHVLLAGQTRSGKTTTERLIAWNLAHHTTKEEAGLIILDVAKSGYKWGDFGNVASLAHPIITTIEEADAILFWLTIEIKKRGWEKRNTPKLFVFVDELKALIDDSRVAEGYLSRIAATGGEFGLHLILATQYPQIKLLGSSELKRNLTTRLVGKMDDAIASNNAVGLPGAGAETLHGYGDFLLRDGTGLARLTVAKIEPKHVEQLPRVEEVPIIELPQSYEIYGNATKPVYEPDPIDPEHLALAVFEPMGINKLARRLNIGNTKATRIQEQAKKFRQWAYEHGYKCIPSS